jgi:hypothetical protein
MVRKDGKKKKVDKRKGKNGKLSVGEELFKNEYLLNGFNATRAYMKAFSVTNYNSAGVQAYDLMRKSKVRLEIDAQLTKTFTKMEVSNELLIASYVNQAFYDERSFFDEDGEFIGMQNLNIVQQMCIESLDVNERYDKDGNHLGTITKIKFYSRKAAMDALAKYKGLITDNNNNTFVFNQDNRKVELTIASDKLKERLGVDRIIELNKQLKDPSK